MLTTMRTHMRGADSMHQREAPDKHPDSSKRWLVAVPVLSECVSEGGDKQGQARGVARTCKARQEPLTCSLS
jgi:hypothetical protein